MPNLIQTTRRRLGVTNGELAARLGVTPGAVSQMERSERDGSIRWETLERALEGLGQQPVVVAREPRSRFAAEAVTDGINRALDDGDEAFALRLLTRAAQAIRGWEGLARDALAERSSSIKDPRWEALFGAVYGDALPLPVKPEWASPQRLRRRWYVSSFAPLRERAKTSTPQRLRDLNIYLDARSLGRLG